MPDITVEHLCYRASQMLESPTVLTPEQVLQEIGELVAESERAHQRRLEVNPVSWSKQDEARERARLKRELRKLTRLMAKVGNLLASGVGALGTEWTAAGVRLLAAEAARLLRERYTIEELVEMGYGTPDNAELPPFQENE